MVLRDFFAIAHTTNPRLRRVTLSHSRQWIFRHCSFWSDTVCIFSVIWPDLSETHQTQYILSSRSAQGSWAIITGHKVTRCPQKCWLWQRLLSCKTTGSNAVCATVFRTGSLENKNWHFLCTRLLRNWRKVNTMLDQVEPMPIILQILRELRNLRYYWFYKYATIT